MSNKKRLKGHYNPNHDTLKDSNSWEFIERLDNLSINSEDFDDDDLSLWWNALAKLREGRSNQGDSINKQLWGSYLSRIREDEAYNEFYDTQQDTDYTTIPLLAPNSWDPVMIEKQAIDAINIINNKDNSSLPFGNSPISHFIGHLKNGTYPSHEIMISVGATLYRIYKSAGWLSLADAIGKEDFSKLNESGAKHSVFGNQFHHWVKSWKIGDHQKFGKHRSLSHYLHKFLTSHDGPYKGFCDYAEDAQKELVSSLAKKYTNWLKQRGLKWSDKPE